MLKKRGDIDLYFSIFILAVGFVVFFSALFALDNQGDRSLIDIVQIMRDSRSYQSVGIFNDNSVVQCIKEDNQNLETILYNWWQVLQENGFTNHTVFVATKKEEETNGAGQGGNGWNVASHPPPDTAGIGTADIEEFLNSSFASLGNCVLGVVTVGEGTEKFSVACCNRSEIQPGNNESSECTDHSECDSVQGCDGGFCYCDQGQCKPCPPGTKIKSNLVLRGDFDSSYLAQLPFFRLIIHLNDPTDTYSNDFCENCTSGVQCNCPEGSFADGQGGCTCPSGQYWNGSECVTCRVGEQCNCPEGEIFDGNGCQSADDGGGSIETP